LVVHQKLKDTLNKLVQKRTNVFKSHQYYVQMLLYFSSKWCKQWKLNNSNLFALIWFDCIGGIEFVYSCQWYTGCLKKTLWKFNRLLCITIQFLHRTKELLFSFSMIYFLNRNDEKWPHTRQIKIFGRNHILPPLGIENTLIMHS
jgi:hypothetical protein